MNVSWRRHERSPGGVRQAWLVARREVRERLRSKGMWAGTVLMLVIVVAAIVVPTLSDDGPGVREVGLVGAEPAGLAETMTEQGASADVTLRLERYDDVDAGEAAVRDEDVDVLVVDARRLVWRDDVDASLGALITAAVQLATVRERAAAVGISPDQLAELAAPVPFVNEELGIVADRSPADETAAYLMSVLLLLAMATYGQLVLTGVVQEKSSRVVEVLLARMPARSLLAGKVAGIGLIGLAQFGLTALAALVATAVVDEVDIAAVNAGVLTWAIVWFVLGYMLFAMAYGAFGSLASRTEDASSIAAPVSALLIAGYWAALVTVGDDPDGGWAQIVSMVPVTAPFAMPGRIALGAVVWWEPVVAAGLAGAAIIGLVVLAGRIYTGAILRTGATVKVRDAWRQSLPEAGSSSG